MPAVNLFFEVFLKFSSVLWTGKYQPPLIWKVRNPGDFSFFFCPQEQQNLSVSCWASSYISRSFSLLYIKDCPCQPAQNYCNQILVFLLCSFPAARRVNQYQPSFLLAMKHQCWQKCLMFLLLLPLFFPIVSSITQLMYIFFYWNSDDRTYPSSMYKNERALKVISFMSWI